LDRDRWRTLVNAVMNFGVSIKGTEFSELLSRHRPLTKESAAWSLCRYACMYGQLLQKLVSELDSCIVVNVALPTGQNFLAPRRLVVALISINYNGNTTGQI
jgi:hypothetical protein